MVNPYSDLSETTNEWIRTFSEVDDSELVWHRDREDREITVLEGSGWKFQRDNEIPFELKKGQIFYINKMIYHRLLKGDNTLKIKIKELVED